MLTNLTEIFKVSKPIIAMIHVQCYADYNIQRGIVQQDLERLERGGVDGLLFENWGGDYPTRQAGMKVEFLRHIIEDTVKDTSLPYGLNVLPCDYEAAFDLAKETGARFVQVDTLVDKVKTDYQNEFVLDIDSKAVLRYRQRVGLESVPLLVNIQTKHYTTIPWNKKLVTSALQAIGAGADVLVVTGKSTGKKTSKEKLLRVKKVAGATPVFIGSGFNEGNAAELLPYAGGVIVGTSLKYNGITENPVEEERVKKMMEVIKRLR